MRLTKPGISKGRANKLSGAIRKKINRDTSIMSIKIMGVGPQPSQEELTEVVGAGARWIYLVADTELFVLGIHGFTEEDDWMLGY